VEGLEGERSSGEIASGTGGSGGRDRKEDGGGKVRWEGKRGKSEDGRSVKGQGWSEFRLKNANKR
jgi:hypothetical protein